LPIENFLLRTIEDIRALHSYLDSEALLQEIIKIVCRGMQTDYVLLVGVEGELLDPVAHSKGWNPQAYSLDVIRKALQSNSGYWYGNLEESPSDSQQRHKILSCLAARLNSGGRIIGAIYCDIREGDRRFNISDGENLKLLADFLTVYVDQFELKYNQHESEQTNPSIEIDEILIGEASATKELKRQIQDVAKHSSTSVLIRGERGSGKEIVASLLHSLSDRAKKELVVVHCASISKELFESELFGHEKGAFTGATIMREGRIRRAEGGTLFLDEIADTPYEFQIKLLRLLQNKTFYRVGSDIPVGPVDVRFIFATNRDLEKMTENGMLREDFYDRLTMGRVLYVPPLRERLSDVQLLARRFAFPKAISDEAVDLLMSIHDWPGNVRQLEAVVKAAGSVSSVRTISKDAVQNEILVRKLNTNSENASGFLELKQKYKDGIVSSTQMRELLIQKFNDFHAWSKVARHLGCSTPEQVKSFQQWIFNLQRQGILPKEKPNITNH
jgi:transcriptional regulator with GAF, ATPase, and Fis domain